MYERHLYIFHIGLACAVEYVKEGYQRMVMCNLSINVREGANGIPGASQIDDGGQADV
jgi:hypothetical protein